jgi:hypothetical protein
MIGELLFNAYLSPFCKFGGAAFRIGINFSLWAVAGSVKPILCESISPKMPVFSSRVGELSAAIIRCRLSSRANSDLFFRCDSLVFSNFSAAVSISFPRTSDARRSRKQRSSLALSSAKQWCSIIKRDTCFTESALALTALFTIYKNHRKTGSGSAFFGYGMPITMQ